MSQSLFFDLSSCHNMEKGAVCRAWGGRTHVACPLVKALAYSIVAAA